MGGSEAEDEGEVGELAEGRMRDGDLDLVRLAVGFLLCIIN